jgi:alkylation response protein AidB-like acyl-CoA dehydrogenase
MMTRMVSLHTSPTQADLDRALGELLEAECPMGRVRTAQALGFDADLWASVDAVVGQCERSLDLVTAALLSETLGRFLAPIPFVEHVVARRAFDRAGAPVPDGILSITVSRPAGRLVPAGAIADHVVAVVDGELVDLVGAPPSRAVRNLADLPLADRGLGDRVAIGGPSGVPTVHARAVAEWLVLTAAQLVGLATRSLELTVEHVTRREQFGVPIGSFQTIGHRLADHATAIDGARLAVWQAAWRAEEPDHRAPFCVATETARAMTASAMQFHGGRGFCLDTDTHLFHCRARGWPLVAGDLRRHWERAGAVLFAGADPAFAPEPDAPADGIDFSPPEHADAFRAEVRDVLAEFVTPEVVARVHDTGTVHDADFHRELAARGWIGASWPVEDGGQGRDPWEMRVFAEECARVDAPTDGLSIVTMIGNTIRVVGTPEQKARVLPPILRGEVLLCMGYSEPEAGSDVAATRTTAVCDGDDWVINGEKIFTSMAHEANYVFLLTRTNPEVPKHRGLTMFLVPMDTPGVSVEPLWTLGAPGRTNRTLYRDVRVSDSARIGEVDGGWAVMNVALTFERGGGFTAVRALDHAVEWAREHGRLDDPDVVMRLARVHAANEVSALLSLRSTWLHATGALPGVEGSMAKLYSASAFQTSTADLLELVGADALLHESESDAPVDGVLEYQWRKSPVVTIYGGTNEILRTIIAERHLGLPRTR